MRVIGTSTVRTVDIGGLELGGIFGGIATVLSGAFGALMKARTDRALKQIEVSASWQQQMLERISLLEQKLEVERRRGEAASAYYTRKIESLRHEHIALRRDYDHLKEENREFEAEAWQARERLAVLDHRNAELELYNTTLRNELREIHIQVHDLRTIPPMTTRKGKIP